MNNIINREPKTPLSLPRGKSDMRTEDDKDKILSEVVEGITAFIL